jgi:protein disulfide-isomerase-like protein
MVHVIREKVVLTDHVYGENLFYLFKILGIAEFIHEDATIANWKPFVSKVAVLDTLNFTDWVLGRSLSLIEFYSPTCGHCKQLTPKYEKAAQILSELQDPIDLAKVDAVQETRLASKFDITAFPTLIVFRRAEHFEYTGGRSSDGSFFIIYLKTRPLLFSI